MKMAGIRRRGGRAWLGKGGGRVLAHLGFRFEGWTGRRRSRRASVAWRPWTARRGCLRSAPVRSGDPAVVHCREARVGDGEQSSWPEMVMVLVHH
jgi:hypothetical protein